MTVVKSDIRTIGIDDAAFNREKDSTVPVLGIVVRGNHIIEGVIRTDITIDGLDATEKIKEMIKSSKFYTQLRAIFFASSTIAAFNVIDMNYLYNETKIPVIVILQKLPNNKKVRNALEHLPDNEQRLKILEDNPPLQSIRFYNGQERLCKGYVQYVGIGKEEVVKLLEITSYMACIPECLRVADLIGRSYV